MSEQEIFLAAVEISDPQARQAYLDQACAGNQALRQEVEALLKVHATAGDFLATPAVQQMTAQSTANEGGESLQAPASADDEKTHGYAQNPQAGDDEVSLGFLSPSTNPGSLGRLGHYEVHELLGHGAFGIVLKAFDERLHRMVAIKVMSPELASTSPPRKRFLREARASAAIRHENVVAIYAVEEQPIPYLVMEYIPGLTLDRALKENGPLDVADVLRIGQQIALGLAAAHAQGLIHRDIKPANILLENGLTGRVKISDFGLARAADDASLTTSGTIAGTPLYMSPEQATTGKIDQRSDLFSFGSVLYVMVSGRPPFRAGNSLAVLKRVVEDTPRPIPEIIADVPSWLCVVIAKLHAKRPNARFAAASEVGELLGRYLADLQANRPVQLPPGMQVEQHRSAEAVERDRQLSASDESHPSSAALSQSPASSLQTSSTVDKPRETLAQAWHDWWSERDRWVALSVQTVLLLTYLVCMVSFVSMSTDQRRDLAGHKAFAYRLGVPEPWFQFNVFPQPSTPFETKINPFSSSVWLGLLGCAAFYVFWRIEKVRNPRISKWNHPRFMLGLWGTGALFAVVLGCGMGLFALGNQRHVAAKVDAVKQAALPVPTDPDRAAAEWILSIGGAIQIQENGELRQTKELPQGAFELTAVMLGAIPNATDPGLAKLKDCKNLQTLDLNHPKVTDAGLAHFQNCKNLTRLHLQGSAVTDAGLVYFKDCQNLDTLVLITTKVGDAGLANFKDCKNLGHLRLDETQVTDAGLAHLKDCKNIQVLGLGGTQVTDAGLAHFKDCKDLRCLFLDRTRVTDAGLAHFKDCKDLTEINLWKTQVTDAGLAQLKDCRNFTVLHLEGTPVTDAGVIQLQNCKNLTHLILGSTQVTDAGLAHFQDCKKLTTLFLDRTQVTDAGLAHFRNCQILETLQLDNTKISDAGLVELVRRSHLQQCHLLNTRISLSGYEQLRAAQPNLKITWSETNRMIAERVLALGGTVEIGTPGHPESRPVAKVAELPTDYFQVRRVSLADVKQPLADFAEMISQLKYAQFDQLESLDLSGFAGLTYEFLTPIHGLRELNLSNAGLTDISPAQLPKLPTLQRLVLDGNDIRGPGLAVLKEQPQLIDLSLSGTNLTDEGIKPLSGLTNLKTLDVRKTKVTAAGIDELKQALPKCRIEWDGVVIEPTADR